MTPTGRQLLIDEILDYVGNEKPVERILLNALDEKSIHESLGDLRSTVTSSTSKNRPWPEVGRIGSSA